MGLPFLEFELEDASGNVFPLSPETRWLLEISGLGMPPITHWETRPPGQHGTTHWGYIFQPRIVDVILGTRAGSRPGLYQARMANIEAFSPLNSPHILRCMKAMATNTRFTVDGIRGAMSYPVQTNLPGIHAGIRLGMRRSNSLTRFGSGLLHRLAWGRRGVPMVEYAPVTTTLS